MTFAVGASLCEKQHPDPLRVGFFGQPGPYAEEALQLLLAHAGADFQIVWVVEGLRRMLLGRTWRICRPPWLFSPAQSAARGLAHIAHSSAVPVLQTTNVHTRGVVQTLAAANLDVLLCAGFDRLFQRPLRAQFELCLNAHPSPLPKWRGPSPLFWSIRSCQRQSAVTVHLMDGSEDHGAIVSTTPFSWPGQASGTHIVTLAGKLAGGMFLQTLRQLRRQPLQVSPQAHVQATRAPRPRAEDARIEPLTWRGEDLLDFACAAPFFKTPWLHVGSETFFIRRGIHFTPGLKVPGDFVLCGDRLDINCQDGAVCMAIQTEDSFFAGAKPSTIRTASNR